MNDYPDLLDVLRDLYRQPGDALALAAVACATLSVVAILWIAG